MSGFPVYANQNPYKYVDPDGEYAVLAALAVGYAAFELASTAYDVYDAGRTLADPNSSGLDKGLSIGGLAAGVLLPGPGRAYKEGAELGLGVTKGVPDSTVICRGGTCKADLFTNGNGVTTDAAGKLSGVSTGIGDSVAAASKNIPHKKVGVTTVGDIRAAGGKVVNDRGNHANVSGITAEQAAGLFKNVVKNPNK